MADVYDILKDLNYLEDSILFGDKALELDGVLSYGYNNPQAVLELQNACVEASPADCSTFENGVMTRGIHAARTGFGRRRQITCQYHCSANGREFDQYSFSIDEAIAQLRTLDRDYLDPAYDKATTYYLSNIRQVMSWFSNFNLAFSITYIIMLSGIYLLLIRPLLRSLGDDLRRTAALVYMLPPEVFQRVASFRQWAERHMDAGIQGKQTKKG
ncbi:hypothetical protein BC829DRAFT_181748 [Chytridium lagenaria]|nr:hypothetical protein BC829DRAFT_181748 [Chytridium lagenaria]